MKCLMELRCSTPYDFIICVCLSSSKCLANSLKFKPRSHVHAWWWSTITLLRIFPILPCIWLSNRSWKTSRWVWFESQSQTTLFICYTHISLSLIVNQKQFFVLYAFFASYFLSSPSVVRMDFPWPFQYSDTNFSVWTWDCDSKILQRTFPFVHFSAQKKSKGIS